MVEISAILTTRNRAHLLPRVLSALAVQNIDAARFEIIAIDDGSTDATPQVLAHWETTLRLRIFRQNHAGLAAAKNLGVLVARSPIVVFLDDDDVVDEDLLRAHLAAHIRHPESTTAVLGHTRLSAGVADVPVMRHVTEVGCQLFSYGWMKEGQWLSHTEFWGGRSSCKRELLVQHGLFRPEFTFGCEDIELGWRLARHGLRVLYEPKARTSMIRSLTFDQFCARSYRQGRSQRVFAQLHQEADVRTYCEIDSALSNWPRQRMGYGAHLRWTRELDRLAINWTQVGLTIPKLFQQTLDTAYRTAFALSRAKGVMDMDAQLSRKPTEKIETGFRSLMEFGLQPLLGANVT